MEQVYVKLVTINSTIMHKIINKKVISTYDQQMKDANRQLRIGNGISALEIYNHVLKDNPNDMRAWVGVAMAMTLTLQWAHAAETFEFVLSREPHNPNALYGLSAVKQAMGNYAAARNAIDAACIAAPNVWLIHRFRAHVYTSSGASPAEILQLYCDWGRRFADPLTAAALPFPPLTKAKKNPRRRLKIGYVSGDLRLHSIAFFIEPVFEHHDPSQVDVHVYSTSTRDAYTQRMVPHVPHWHDVFDLSEDELFKLIRRHQIDVLIDLSGHTAGDRMMVFARRAAPVQLTWMGYMYPLGMKAIEYRFTDPVSIPPEAEKYYSEIPFQLECGSMYYPPRSAELCFEPPLERNGYPTFISLNNSRKVTDEMLALWNKILQRRPDAHLILMTDEIETSKAISHMQPRVEAMGLPLDRITICKKLKLDEFMMLGELADVQLDTSPISGGTTTYHALWMGLPVVTLDGKDASSKSTKTILSQLGFNEYIVQDEDGYINKALALADDVVALKRQRLICRPQMLATPVMNYAKRTAELEKAYRLLWCNYLLKEPRFKHANYDLESVISTCFPGTSDRNANTDLTEKASKVTKKHK